MVGFLANLNLNPSPSEGLLLHRILSSLPFGKGEGWEFNVL